MYGNLKNKAAFQPSITFAIQDEQRELARRMDVIKKHVVAIKKRNPEFGKPVPKKPPRGRAGEPGIPMSEWAADKSQGFREDGKPLGDRSPLGSSLEIFRNAIAGMLNSKKEN